MYGLEDLTEGKGEPIIGRFYENELSAVDKKDDVYRVEKTSKKKESERGGDGISEVVRVQQQA